MSSSDSTSSGHDDLRSVRDQLAGEFSGSFSPETVAKFVDESISTFDGPGMSAYLPRLVERYARDLLQAVAQSRGFLPKVHPEVLFVCVRNAGRSQMAAALLEHHARDIPISIRCAGTKPAKELDAGVAAVMAEIGLPMVDSFPKPLHRALVEAADVIVTMGCGDACPVLPGRVYEDWSLQDPVGMSVDELRRLRDEIDTRVQTLMERLRDMGSLQARS